MRYCLFMQNVSKEWYTFLESSIGGDETRLGYEQYVQGIQPNIPTCTMFIDIYMLMYLLALCVHGPRFTTPKFSPTYCSF